jgi:hypothetical protein
MFIWVCLHVKANQVKVVHIFNGHGGQLVRVVNWLERSLAIPRDRSSNPAGFILQIWQLNSHQYMEILDGKFPYINENATLDGQMKHPAPRSIDGNLAFDF